MCNIITFRFTCNHTLHRRRSQCSGTKHKVTASSTKAACVAESFLTLYLRIECNACQHQAWSDAWTFKLRRAQTFLEKLQQRHMPGVAAITGLVKQLEAEFATASWSSRQMFAHGPKPSITRVKHTYYERGARSKLPREVRPEDVVETKGKEWGDMGEEDYDGDYEASTDPIHPVSTDYWHAWDDDDGSWVARHLEGENVGIGGDADVEDVSWDWGNDWEAGIQDSGTTDRWEQDESWAEERSDIDGTQTTSRFTPITSSAENEPLVTTTTSSPTAYHDQEEPSRIQQVIQAFWSVVNSNHHHHLPPSPPPTPTPARPSSLSTLLADLTITTSPSSPSSPTTPPTPPSSPPTQDLRLDGPCSPPPRAPTPAPTPPSPNSTRTWYDKQRQLLQQRNGLDVRNYYVDWLYISRCEMRDFEGPEGRMIREPVGEDGSVRGR